MSAGLIKIFGYICMLFDHCNCVFPEYFPYWFRYTGRFAFTIFAYYTAEGCRKTGNIKKYISRLFIAAAISEIPYDFCFGNEYSFLEDLNIIWTLAAGAALIFIIKYVWEIWLKLLLAAALLASTYFLDFDYGLYGITLIGILYLCKNRLQTAVAVILIFTVKWYKYILPLSFYTGVWFFSCISFLPILLYNGKKGSIGGRYFYIIYPVHILALGIIRSLL